MGSAVDRGSDDPTALDDAEGTGPVESAQLARIIVAPMSPATIGFLTRRNPTVTTDLSMVRSRRDPCG
jgi:hypothetical protein